MMYFRPSHQSAVYHVLCFISWVVWAHTTPLNINAESQEKLTNKINTLLNQPSSQNEFSPSMLRDNGANNSPMTNQALSNFVQPNVELIEPQDTLKHKSVVSEYSLAVQKMIQNAKSPLESNMKNQALNQDDQLSAGAFSRGESMALLGTEELRSEKPDALVGSIQSSNISLKLDSIKNLTQQAVTLTSVEANSVSQKPSVGLRFLASVSPEEFLKRLKKHLEISRSNLKILKRNFHDFVKEKETLFRMNQKVSQEHPNPAGPIKVSVIQAEDSAQEVPFADAQNPATLPQLVNPQPISKVCPHDCPVSMIHIEHHHHGNSPVPCICGNDNPYADMKEECSITG